MQAIGDGLNRPTRNGGSAARLATVQLAGAGPLRLAFVPTF